MSNIWVKSICQENKTVEKYHLKVVSSHYSGLDPLCHELYPSTAQIYCCILNADPKDIGLSIPEVLVIPFISHLSILWSLKSFQGTKSFFN